MLSYVACVIGRLKGVVTSPAEERPTIVAPPVVAVMVVHEPGDWFAETLASLAAQDYPDVRLVAFLTGTTPATVEHDIRRHHPDAIVRYVEGNPGFGPVANQVSGMVDGRDGFFLFLHDDVALRSDAIRQLVEEAYRSNAALVGPKLVEWDAPTVLQHVGFDADRTGRLVDVADPGERDQEQHDAVRDTFVLSSACLLVRNDIFREVGGFDAHIAFLGEERDLCWRVHLLGARVVVNPAAVVRHRGGFATRANLVGAHVRAERIRVRTVVACVALSQVPLTVLRLLVQSVMDTVLGLFTGQQRRGLAGLRAVGALVVDAPMLVARRRRLRQLRRVPSGEVTSLQLRSSARLAAYARHRRALREQHTSEIPAIGQSTAPTSRGVALVGLAALVVVIVGSRSMLLDGVNSVGQFIPLAADDVGTFDLLRAYLAGWSPVWFGAPGAAPTYVGALAVAGIAWFGSWAGLLTAFVVGALIIGPIGAWRLSGVFGAARVRMFGALVYAAFPVGILAVRDGRRDALIVWALAPWILDFARRIAGLGHDEPTAMRESSVRPTGGRRSQLMASVLLLVAIASTVSPAVLVIVALLAVVLGVGAALTATPLRASAWLVGSLGIAIAAAVVLHVPWSVRFVAGDWWTALVGASVPATNASLVEVLTLGVDNVVWRALLLGAYVPVVLMAFVVRRARASWTTRAMLLVFAPTLLGLLAQRSVIDISMPEPLMLGSLSALGVCLSATAAFAAFSDGRTKTFTWQQLLATLAVVGVLSSGAPSVIAAADGRWLQPTATLSQLVTQLPDDTSGDYAVVYLGDPRLLPVSSVLAGDARTAFGVLHDGEPVAVELLPATQSPMTTALARAVDVILTGESLRGGRLLAPLAVRFVVVPLRDGTLHSRRDSSAGALGNDAVARLSDQLDFRRVYTATDLVIFENMAALPTASVLDEKAAVASRQALEANLLADGLMARAPFATGFAPERRTTGESLTGTVHLAVPYSSRWVLSVEGARVAPRVAFGATTAFDAPVAGTAELRLRSSIAHRGLLAVQLGMWIIVVAIAFNPSRFRGRVRAAREVVEVSLRKDDVRTAVERKNNDVRGAV